MSRTTARARRAAPRDISLFRPARTAGRRPTLPPGGRFGAPVSQPAAGPSRGAVVRPAVTTRPPRVGRRPHRVIAPQETFA